MWAEISDKQHIVAARLSTEAVREYYAYVFGFIVCSGERLPDGGTRPQEDRRAGRSELVDGFLSDAQDVYVHSYLAWDTMLHRFAERS